MNDYIEQYLLDVAESSTHDTVISTAYIKPVHFQDKFSTENVVREKLPTVVEELLAINICWEKESQYSLRIYCFVSSPCSNGEPHKQEYLGCIKLS